MNKLCEICGGSCCKWQLLSEGWLQNTGAKEVHYEGEQSNNVSNGFTQIDKTCSHLKNGKCDQYEKRPQPCRNFEVGSKKCFIAMKEKNINLYNRLLKL